MLAKVQIGVTVTHKKFGSGAIVWIDSAKKYLRVKFDAGEMQFVYPDAFLLIKNYLSERLDEYIKPILFALKKILTKPLDEQMFV